MCYPNYVIPPRITLNDCFKTISIKEVVDNSTKLILISRNMVASEHIEEYIKGIESMLEKNEYKMISAHTSISSSWTYERIYAKKDDEKNIVVSSKDTNLIKRFNPKIIEDRIAYIATLLNQKV